MRLTIVPFMRLLARSALADRVVCPGNRDADTQRGREAMSAIGTFVITAGQEKRPVANYVRGFAEKEAAQAYARIMRGYNWVTRPVRVVQVNERNCRDLLASWEFCPNAH